MKSALVWLHKLKPLDLPDRVVTTKYVLSRARPRNLIFLDLSSTRLPNYPIWAIQIFFNMDSIVDVSRMQLK